MMPLTLISEGFYNSAKPHPTCILPSVMEGIFYYLPRAQIFLYGLAGLIQNKIERAETGQPVLQKRNAQHTIILLKKISICSPPARFCN